MAQKRPPDSPVDVKFNFDTWEREGAPGPFAVVLGGRRYVLQDAEQCDYRELIKSQRLATSGDFHAAIEIVVTTDDREKFFANNIPVGAVGEMFKRFNDHYGIPNPPESNASST